FSTNLCHSTDIYAFLVNIQYSYTPANQKFYLLLFSMLMQSRLFPLFPYTTLFRSVNGLQRCDQRDHHERKAAPDFDHNDRDHCPDRKSTRLNSSHGSISYAVFCLKKKNKEIHDQRL